MNFPSVSKVYVSEQSVLVSQVYNLPGCINFLLPRSMLGQIHPAFHLYVPRSILVSGSGLFFCSCKSRFLQINVDPSFRFSVFRSYVCFQECIYIYMYACMHACMHTHIFPFILDTCITIEYATRKSSAIWR